jgi:hypothetical protein
MFTFVTILTLPMGALAYLVFAPLAIAIDRRIGGRVSRAARVVIGGSLAVPAFVVANLFVWAMDWETTARIGIRGTVDHSLEHPAPLLVLLGAFIVAGAIVGVGLRHASTAATR